MKRTNFTNYQSLTKKLSMFMVMLFISFNGINLNAQCALLCNESTNISLDQMGEALITVEMVADVTQCPGGDFTVTIQEENETPVNNPVTCDYLGETLVVMVTDEISGNFAWGYLQIEDKMAPELLCVSPVTGANCFDIPESASALGISDNCTPDDEIDLQVLTETIDLNSDCANPELVKTITRTYVAVDNSGNVSEECETIIEVNTVESTSSSGLTDEIPNLPNFVGLDAFDCSDPSIPEGEIPPTSLTGGVPTYNGTPLYPNTPNSCLVVTKEDELLSSSGPGHPVTKYMRTWEIYEWSICGNAEPIRTVVQMIDVSDQTGPVITDTPNDFFASTNNYECSGMVFMPSITAVDDCGQVESVTVSYPGGPILEANGGLIELPIGVNEVIYTAYDNAYNSTSVTVTVTVEDLTPPVSICNQYTTVGLTNDGFAHVPATVFDDGSYDECDLERMLVRRMNPNPDCGDCGAPVFSDFTSLGKFNGHYYYLSDNPLSARSAEKHAVAMGGYGVSIETEEEDDWLEAELPGEIDVWIGLSTNGGNDYSWASGSDLEYTNWFDETSNVSPYVAKSASFSPGQSKWIAFSSFPDEARYVIEVAEECSYSEYTAFCCDDIGSESNMVVFRVIDEAGNYNECMVNVEVQDKIGPVVIAPADVTFSCEDQISEEDLLAYEDDLQVFDNCGYTTEVVIDTTNLDNCDVEYTITYTVTDDGDRTSTDSQTVLSDYDYDITASDFDVSAIADAEYADGCEMPDPADYGTDVTGTVVFPSGVCNQLAMSITDDVYYFGQEQSGTCFKILRTFRIINWCETSTSTGMNDIYTFTQTIKVSSDISPTLECGEKLVFESLDNTCQSGEVTITQSAIDNCEAGNAMNYSYSVDGGVAVFGTGTDATVSGTFDVGDHEIQWTFTNACGNSSTCVQEFEVLSIVPPSPICLSSITVAVDTDDVELLVSEYDVDTQHPCAGYTYITSFDAVDLTDNVMTFNCDDEGTIDLSVYYTAVDGSGEVVLDGNGDFVQDFCNVQVVVQCNSNSGSKPVVEGHISTAQSDMIDDVRVDLLGDNIMYEMTDDGAYAFPEMPNGGDYVIDPVKTDGVNNGVSTLDLVLIQRHIVGLGDLEGVYNLIAADINNDDKISSFDIVDLRKVILGINDTFTNNDSWRFVDANHPFVDPTDPWFTEIPESYIINNLNGDMIIDFTAIKVGDVNNSVELPNAVSTSTEVRSNTILSMVADMTQTEDGSLSTIPVITEEAIDLAGLQMTINLGTDVIFASIDAGAMDITGANIGLRYVDRGIITLSWDNTNGVVLKAGDVLFNVVVEAATYNKSTIAVTSDITRAEAFNIDNEVMNVELSVRDNANEGFALMQNTPNPFNEFTVISFNLPKAMNATLTVYDVNGKTLKTISSTYDEGINNIRLNDSELGASGILYYQLQAGNFTANRKMVVFN